MRKEEIIALLEIEQSEFLTEESINDRFVAFSNFMTFETIGDMESISQSEDINFECFSEEYLVLTDEEADKMAWQYIRDSLWAFKASFISHYVDCEGDLKSAIQALQEKQGEDCNEAIYSWVKHRFDDLVADAISSDGRGHYIPSSYDFDEYEEGDYFIYRIS